MSEANNPSPAAPAHWIHWNQVRSAEEAEAAFNETGLTPRQLVEQRNALLKALEYFVDAKPGYHFNCHSFEECDSYNKAVDLLALIKGEPK